MNDKEYEEQIDEIVEEMFNKLSEYSSNTIDDLNIVGRMNEILLSNL